MASSNIKVSHADTGLVKSEVIRSERISSGFVRLTLGGPDLLEWRNLGFDQWFRLALPVSGETKFDRLSERFDMAGYLRYLTLPKATRPVIRNYTVREFRPATGELDIDFVVHGAEGIAGPWAASLPTGAPVALIDQGCGYRPVEGVSQVLLAGDETALPAILGILRDLPAESSGTAIIEIANKDDMQDGPLPSGVDLRWIIRGSGIDPGRAALEELRTLSPSPQVSAFIAGEQRLATGARRYLVNEVQVPKANIDFTGYWRMGPR